LEFVTSPRFDFEQSSGFALRACSACRLFARMTLQDLSDQRDFFLGIGVSKFVKSVVAE
jgi:hypothetical protein